jgi:hypothetical protein
VCSKLNGVPNHVDENLPQPKRVADEGVGYLLRDFAVKFKIFLTGRSDKGLGNSVHKVTQFEFDWFHVQFAGPDFGISPECR